MTIPYNLYTLRMDPFFGGKHMRTVLSHFLVLDASSSLGLVRIYEFAYRLSFSENKFKAMIQPCDESIDNASNTEAAKSDWKTA